MQNRIRIGCCIFLLLAASDSIAADMQAPLKLEPCTPVPNQPGLQCAKLVVPENWDNPTGRNLALNIVVIPAAGPATQVPLYDFPGGPGETNSAEFWLTAGSIYRAHRDIVLIDQRGTGGSHPLNCTLPFSDLSRGTLPTDAA